MAHTLLYLGAYRSDYAKQHLLCVFGEYYSLIKRHLFLLNLIEQKIPALMNCLQRD